MSIGSSPALIIRFPHDTTPAERDRLVGLLADHDLVAIQEDDLSAPRAWTAHFASAESRAAAAAAIGGVAAFGALQLTDVDVEDDDWARRTQADLPAIRVGRIVVAPPWDLPDVAAGPPSAGDIVVEIEPSRGFGTGHHQSTRLCLVLLQNRDLAQRTVIDVGTGSGVLAIAAAKLGAGFVAAFDSDPDAIENARENVARNGVAHTVEVHVRDLRAAGVAPADVVTANLTGTLLARHADALGALVRSGGSLIIAGFTIDEKPIVLEAFEPHFGLAESAEEDDWWAFVLRG
ncbi:MAG: 50S ribosomal protein L11 methyltransferase [Vicinamibacterales bacterium]